MNPVYQFSTGDHGVTLGDQIRLELYRRAILRQVKPGMPVAEIGTGTGILSAYAATATQAPVSAIEISPRSADLAEAMMRAAGYSHVKIVRGKADEVVLDTEPAVLITETIGTIGPEENIVELCYDFKRRHPTIRTLIPARLKVWAEAIRSSEVREMEQEYFARFKSASFDTFQFSAIQDELKKVWCGWMRFTNLAGSETVGKPILIADYELGVTEHSAFQKDLDFSAYGSFDAVHLYFETELDPETMLTSHHSDPETHWRHCFVAKPTDQSLLEVAYSDASESLEIRWK